MYLDKNRQIDDNTHFTKNRLITILELGWIIFLVKKEGIGKVSSLSNHRPVYLHLFLSKVRNGRGFWRLNEDMLKDPNLLPYLSLRQGNHYNHLA